MTIKTLEIWDEGTFIGALAIKMQADNETAQYYFNRCGYPHDGSSIMLMVLATGKATNDPYEWAALGLGRRTMPIAHKFIIEQFEKLADGDVVDVAVLLGERYAPKVSERLSVYAAW